MNLHVASRHWKDLDIPGKIDAIKSVYEPGMSARQIAECIPGAGRNSIIGVYHRHADKLEGFTLPSTGGGVTRNGTKSATIIAYIHANPEATAPEIAAKTGTNHAYVHKVVKANGLSIPRGDVGGNHRRPGKPPSIFSNARHPQEIAGRSEYDKELMAIYAPKPQRPAWRDFPIPADAPAPLNLTLMQLTDSTCKWSVAGENEHMLFCGRSSAKGRPYCAYHCARSSGSFHCEEQAA